MIDESEFASRLPDGWKVEILRSSTGYVVTARHALYGSASIGPKLRLVAADVGALRLAVDDVIAPPLTYSQWMAAGRRQGYLLVADDAPLPRALRLLAICIERDDVEASDVAQALFRGDAYPVDCPVAEASHCGHDVAELRALLRAAAEQYGFTPYTHENEV